VLAGGQQQRKDKQAQEETVHRDELYRHRMNSTPGMQKHAEASY